VVRLIRDTMNVNVHLALHWTSGAKPSIPDIEPFIANDQSAIRYYFTFAVLVFAVGVAIIGVTFYPVLKRPRWS
jgi:hypothetical protein